MMIVASVLRQRVLWCCALALFVGVMPGVAALPALIPREVLCSRSQRAQVQLSRDGASLAYLSPDAHGVPQICLRMPPTGAVTEASQEEASID